MKPGDWSPPGTGNGIVVGFELAFGMNKTIGDSLLQTRELRSGLVTLLVRFVTVNGSRSEWALLARFVGEANRLIQSERSIALGQHEFR
jgi:hypothetical protein